MPAAPHDWTSLSVKDRCRIIASVAPHVCGLSQSLIDACRSPQRPDPVDTISSELIPFCAALRFIGRRGPGILRPRRVGYAGRPAWLFGVHSRVYRVPLGEVLVLGAWNYPILLPGVQCAQALAAGNRVLLKPAAGTEEASRVLVKCFYDAGVPASQLSLLGSATSEAEKAIASGVDLVVLTGAAETGRKVLAASAPRLSASIMELSGCDAVIVLSGHDGKRVIEALRFGLTFNGSATCIAPRRVIVTEDVHDVLAERLNHELATASPIIVHPSAREAAATLIEDAIAGGATDSGGRFDAETLRKDGTLSPTLLTDVTTDMAIASADLFAPVSSLIRVRDSRQAIEIVNDCPYRLAASVFGPPSEANRIAARLDVGTVTINDLIAPTADPRLPFGGRGQSGFGVTRGVEGLQAMTALKVVSQRRGSVTPHLDSRKPGDSELLHGALHSLYGKGPGMRLAGLRQIVSSQRKSGDETPKPPRPE